MPSQSPPTYRTQRWLFPRLLALVYAIAFASWLVQCDGLVGEQGILPARDFMANVHAYAEREHVNAFWQVPTLFYWHYSDALLHGVCWMALGLCVLVMLGVWQGPILALLWFGYLSIATTGGIFMGYQWDAMLLEAGFVALFFVSWRLRARLTDAPAGSAFLLHWLAFRLMLLSGYVKIGGGDLVWENSTALMYHFETQPLPNPLAWWAHHLPRWLQVFNCWAMYAIELGLPFAIFCGRWGRLIACTGFCLLMGGVAMTGNYNFFNLLTIVVSLTLLDDSWIPAKVKHWLRVSDAPRLVWQGRHVHVYACAIVLTVFSVVAADLFLIGRIPQWTSHTPSWLSKTYSNHLAPWRSINAYGLFQDMTEERLEVVIEVSDDGIFWRDLSFKYKPGALKDMPRQIAPHQPRLDWQMWFAALYPGYVPQRDADPRSPMHWFGPFMNALVEHRPAVWALVDEPPMPLETITHARAMLYRYRFATPAERETTGQWWIAEKRGPFSPTFSMTARQ